ncbi:MAG: metallophosphoesterase, partial [Methanoregulaceae archaeon]|nr:metallophosphoesterase [Methanoregulaceae archaeon]
KFLDGCSTPEVDHFVLCGDIFDFWRRTNVSIFCGTPSCNEKIKKIVGFNDSILDALVRMKARNVYYVVGNHDYLVYRIHNDSGGEYPFNVFKTLRIQDDGKSYVFTHGCNLDVMSTMEHMMTVKQYEQLAESLCFLTDKTGWLASSIWRTTEILGKMKEQVVSIQKSPKERMSEMDSVRMFADSSAGYLLLGLKPDENLVFGHTHVPYISQKKSGTMAGNTGCWGEDMRAPDGTIRRNSYIRIDDGRMDLRFFRGENPADPEA